MSKNSFIFWAGVCLLTISMWTGCGGGQDASGPSGPQKPKVITPEEQERLDQAARDSRFPMFRQCQVKIGEQAQNLDAIVKSVVQGKKCLSDAQMGQFENDVNALFNGIDAFAKEFDQVPQTNVSKALFETAHAKIGALLADYEEIQGTLSYCRTKTILDGVTPTEQLRSKLGHNLFLVALGDIFGKDTGYEGNLSHITVGHRLNALKLIKERTKGLTFIKDEAQAHPCQGLGIDGSADAGAPHPDLPEPVLAKLIEQHSNALTLLEDFEGSIDKLKAEMAKQLAGLQKDESLFLPFSWSGHAFAFEITRETQDPKPTYTFRIFNSGEGINTYHASAQAGYKVQYFPHLEVVEVPHANLVSPVFLKSLQEITHPQARKSEPAHLYEEVLQIIGGKPNPKPYDVSSFRDAQNSGTCAYFSLPWVLDSAVERITAKDDTPHRASLAPRIEYLIGAITLKGYSMLLSEQGLTKVDETQLQLLKKGLNFFSAQQLQLHSDGALDHGDLASLGDEGARIREDVKIAEAQIRNDFYASTPTSIKTLSLNAQGDSTTAPIFREITKAQGSVDSGAIAFDFRKYTLPTSADAVIKDLTDFNSRFLAAMQASRYVEVVSGISELALKIPLEQKPFTFWNQVISDPQVAASIIALFRQIEAAYVFSVLQAIAYEQIPEKQVSTARFLVALKLLAVSDLLNRQFLTNIEPQIPTMNQPHFKWILSDTSVLSEIKDPLWQNELKAVKAHFMGVRGTSFFGLDELPSGTHSGTLRRVLHDPSAINELPGPELHWTEEKEWEDVNWTLDFMKRQRDYSTWKQKRTKESENAYSFSRDYVSPWRWSFSGDYDRSLNPNVKPADPQSRVAAEFDRREAMQLLSGDKDKGNKHFPQTERLPAPFYDLRALSYLTDFLLTAQLDVNSAKKLNFRDDVNFVSAGHEIHWARITGLKQEVRAKKWDVVCIRYSDDNRCAETDLISSIVWNKIDIVKSTDFRGTSLQFSVFAHAQESSPQYSEADDKPAALVKGSVSNAVIRYIRPYFHPQRAFEPFAQYSTDFGPKVDFHHDELMRIYMTGVKDKDGKPILDPLVEQERRQLLPNDLIIRDPSADGLKKLTLERVRAIFTLSGNSELQITETLALFDKFPSLLLRPEYQRLFIKLMFFPGLLDREYQVSPLATQRFMERLVDFCKRNFALFERRGNLKAMAFILQVNQLFKDNWAYIESNPKTKKPVNFVPAFFDTPARLLELAAALPAERAQQKSFLYRNVLEAYLNPTWLSDVDVEQLLFAAIEHRVLAISDANFDDPFMEAQVRHIMTYKLPVVRDKLFKDDKLSDSGQQLLERVVKRLRPDLVVVGKFEALEPKRSGFLSRAIYGARADDLLIPSVIEAKAKGPGGETTIQIDISKGSFYDAGQNSVPFPLSATEYEARFGTEKHPEKATQIGFQTFEWVGDSGRSYRAKRDVSGNWTFQMRVESQWYQFVQDRDVALDVQGFFPGLDHWQSTGSDRTTTFLIFDRAKKKLMFRTTAQCADDTPRSCQIASVAREKDKATLAFLNDDAYPVRVLSQLELPPYIYVWLNADDSKRISDVELPRLGLTFRPLSSDPSQLDCADVHAGTNKLYKIADVQYSALLHKPVNYLICDEVNSKSPLRLALSPIEQFEFPLLEDKDISKGETASTTLQATKYQPARRLTQANIMALGERTIKLATYRLPTLENGIEAMGGIEPTSDAARLYLALRHVWQLDYRSAKQQIDEVTTSDRKMSQDKGELSILSWILRGRPDADPRANAVRLLAGATLIKQNRYFNAPLGAEQKAAIAQVYGRYLSTISSITPDWISFFDEYVVANYPFEVGIGAALTNRLKVLNAMYPQSKLSLPRVFAAAIMGVPYQMPVITAPSYSIDDLAQILEKKDSGPGFKTVRDACGVITTANFDVLYDVAADGAFPEGSARSLLAQLTSAGDLNKVEVRNEWVKVFQLNAQPNSSCQQLASFFFMLSRLDDKSTIPSSSELHHTNTRIKDLARQITELHRRISDVEGRIGSLQPPNRQIWSHARGQYVDDPSYPSRWSRYEQERDRLERERQAFYDAVRRVRAEHDALIASLERRLLKRVAQSIYQEKTFQPSFTAERDLPVKTPIGLGIKEPSAEFFKAIDLTASDAVDLLNTPLLAPGFTVFQLNPLSEEEKQRITDDIESLKRELDKGRDGPAQVVAGIETLKRNLDAYRNKLLSDTTRERLVSPKAIPGLITTVSSQITTELANRDKLVTQALDLARKQSTLFSQAAYQRVLKLADSRDDLAIEELTQLLAASRLKELYTATQGNLKLDEVKELYTVLYKLLLSNTFISHATAYQKALVSLNTLIARAVSKQSEAYAAAVNNVVLLGRQTRAYNAADHVEYLMLENYMGFLLRKAQVDSLDALKLKGGTAQGTQTLGAVIEMIMGSGKTAVLLPLLSILNSQDEWLNIVMLPESLVASMARQLSQQLAKGYGRSVDVIEITRATPLGEGDLKALYDRLLRAQVEHRTLVTTNSSVQSLFLSFIAALHEFSKGDKNYEKPIAEFVKIFQLLRAKGRLTIDEVDLALDILQSHQFSIKPRIEINETLTNTVFSFYRFLTRNNFGIRLSFIAGSKGEALSEGSYKRVRGRIVDAITSDENLFNDSKGLDKLYRFYISDPRRRQLLATYFNTDKIADRTALFADIEKSVANRGKEAVDAMKNISAALYEEINNVFLLTASKKLQIHYGPMPMPKQDKENDESNESFALRLGEYRQSSFLAIPYHAGNPVVNSRFGTAIEALNYTMQMQLEQKNYSSQLLLEVNALKKLAERDDEGSVRLFTSRFDLLRKGTKISIYDVDEEMLKSWAARLALGSEPPLEFALIHSYVLPQVKSYRIQLQTNAQIYESLFSSVQGFSGTLWSADTFPDVFKAPLYSDTAEKTFYLLWSQYQARKKEDPSYKAIRTHSREHLMSEFDWGFAGSDIDDGGLFRGIDNVMIAKKKMGKSDSKVIYYDKENNIVVMNPGDTVTPIEEPQVPQENRFAFWDKKHTTGSDLKLAPDMRARLTFDYHTVSRDIQQSTWRLRGLDKGQSIEKYLVLDEDLEVIVQKMKDRLGLTISDFELGDLLLYSVMNQELRLSDLLFRSTKQKMKNAVIKEVMNQMFSGNQSPQTLVDMYHPIRQLFETNLMENPYHLSGFPKSALPKSVALSKEKESVLSGAISQALKDTRYYPQQTFAALERSVNGVIARDEPKLPPFINVAAVDEGLEVEIETELEQEMEQEQETEREVEPFNFDPKYKPHTVLSWPFTPPESVFYSDYFTPVSPSEFLKSRGARPFVTLKGAFASGRLAWISPIISPDLHISLNYAPLHYKHAQAKAGEISYVFDFYNLYYKNLTNLLVVLDRKDNLTLVMIDNNDASQFDRFLIADHGRDGDVSTREYRIGLYSLEQGLFRTGREPIEMSELESHPQFIESLSQAKFLNGELEYSNDELVYLQDWIVRNGVEKMYTLFVQDILKYKQDSREALKYSSIGRLFENLRTEQ